MPTYYEILGVSPSIQKTELEKVIRKKLFKWHPDRWIGKTDDQKKIAEKKTQELSEIKSILLDDEKRKYYDKHGDNWEFYYREEQQEVYICSECRTEIKGKKTNK